MSDIALQELNSRADPIQDDKTIKATPKNVPSGANNEYIKNVKFEVGQADYKMAYVTLTDADKERWSIPEEFVNKTTAQQTMDLDMCGFELFKQPFGFRFVDPEDKDNVYLTTKD